MRWLRLSLGWNSKSSLHFRSRTRYQRLFKKRCIFVCCNWTCWLLEFWRLMLVIFYNYGQRVTDQGSFFIWFNRLKAFIACYAIRGPCILHHLLSIADTREMHPLLSSGFAWICEYCTNFWTSIWCVDSNTNHNCWLSDRSGLSKYILTRLETLTKKWITNSCVNLYLGPLIWLESFFVKHVVNDARHRSLICYCPVWNP